MNGAPEMMTIGGEGQENSVMKTIAEDDINVTKRMKFNGLNMITNSLINGRDVNGAPEMMTIGGEGQENTVMKIVAEDDNNE